MNLSKGGKIIATKKIATRVKCPIRRLLKKEIFWLHEHKCKHGHSYLEHYSCYVSEKPDDSPIQEKVGIFDIETTGLKANWSHVLCWCMKEQGTDIIHQDLITSKHARDKNDNSLIKSAVEEIKKYDRIVTWYGTRFDLPYVRSRAIFYDIDFPSYQELYHTDLYYLARSKLALHSNRLGAVCQFFGIEAKNHPMTPQLWAKAGAGDKEALDTVLEHCQEDVISTDKCYDLLLKYSATIKRSI